MPLMLKFSLAMMSRKEQQVVFKPIVVEAQYGNRAHGPHARRAEGRIDEADLAKDIARAEHGLAPTAVRRRGAEPPAVR
jgi:hypothetical protein